MKILNFGSLNIDYVYNVQHFMRPGETQASDKLELFCGGKGLNQSIALSRSGADVWHAGAVGKSDSSMLLEVLEKSGVKTNFIKKVDGNSGHAIIQKDIIGQNSILLYGGANQEITEEDVKKVLINFEPGDFLVLQNEISCMKEIMEQAHKLGLKIVFNPSPMNLSVLEYPLEYVNYFFLNEVEARDLCETDAEGDELIEKVANIFPNAQIVLTLGEKGALYQFKDTKLKHGSYQVEVVDTTAAGDTFTGYFIGCIANRYPIEKALEISSQAAALAVSRAGAEPSIPKLDEVLLFLP